MTSELERVAFERDKAKYHQQWSDANCPITRMEDSAYEAGWFDCYASSESPRLRKEVEMLREALTTICNPPDLRYVGCDSIANSMICTAQQSLAATDDKQPVKE